MTLTAFRALQVAAPGGPLAVIIFRDGECSSTTARNQKHFELLASIQFSANETEPQHGAIFIFVRDLASRASARRDCAGGPTASSHRTSLYTGDSLRSWRLSWCGRRRDEPGSLGTGFQLPKDPEVLGQLDEYEEFNPAEIERSQFVRIQSKATLDDGRVIKAWVYVYNRDPGSAPRIVNGSFAGRKK